VRFAGLGANMTSHILFLNGSIRGASGNTARWFDRARGVLPAETTHDTLTLAEYGGSVEGLAERLLAADALLFGSGVYWGSWGSPLQRFLEVMSSYELSACFLGKPVAALISADSVGGLDVAQRLLGACSLLGCVVPPLSTAVVSRVATAAIEADPEANADVWHADDLGVVINNLLVAAKALRGASWSTWPVKQLPRVEGPYPAQGALASGLAKFM